jgi:hypothetical protein
MPPSAKIGEFKLENAAEREDRRIQVGGSAERYAGSF